MLNIQITNSRPALDESGSDHLDETMRAASNVLTQISVNTREHSNVRVANKPKGSEAMQTGQTG